MIFSENRYPLFRIMLWQKRTRRLQKNARPAGRFTFALSTNATRESAMTHTIRLDRPFERATVFQHRAAEVPRGERDATRTGRYTTDKARSGTTETDARLTPFGP
jgi:hypothetical protein